MTVPIDIAGTVEITGPGLKATVYGRDSVVVLDVSSLWSGWSILQHARRFKVFRLPLAAMLRSADVRLSIRFRGRIIAESGPGISTGRIAAFFGWPGVRLRSFKRPVA